MNLVAIVGRPNVGKSTLFNRIVGSKSAIVEGTPGITRDRIYGESDWNGKNFSLIDTGGFVPGSENTMEKAVREQAFIAIEEADSIIFLCDGRDGVTPFDEDIAQILRNSNKHIVVVVNKCDNAQQDNSSYEFHSLGLGEPFPISALSGRNTGDFLDAVTENFAAGEEPDDDVRLKIAIVGRPNVGKSSLANVMLGKPRSIVTDIPGTTRDAIDSIVKYYGEEIVLIDTAGLRKRSHIKENVEIFSTIRTTKAIERCDVALVVLDASQGMQDQDKKIINQIDEARKGMVMVLNKWDLVEKDSKTADEFVTKIREAMRSYEYVPIVFTSALTKQRVTKIIEIAKEVKKARETRISTSQLNKVILAEFEKTTPPSIQGRDLRINFITQVKTEPPIFAFFCNFPELIPESYKRFMENTLRKFYPFTGTPISFIFRRKNVKWEDRADQQ